MNSCTSLSVNRVALRVGVATVAAAAALVAPPALASAHVSVQPGEVEGGGFSVVSFRVPNEQDDANTIQLRVLLPPDQPVGSVQTTPMTGWKITTKDRTLAKPIDMFGSKISSVVSEVTWTATGPGVPPGQFQDFDLNLGPLPESGQMVFKAVQTYSGGEQVHWIDVAEDGSLEPEHPAPVLTLAPAAAADDVSASSTSGQTSQPSSPSNNAQVPEGTAMDGGSNDALPISLSVVALLVSLAALALAWRRTTGTTIPRSDAR
jgi:uncharacterized protein YcnI